METWQIVLTAIVGVIVVTLAGMRDLVATWFTTRKSRMLRQEQESRQTSLEKRYADGFGLMLQYNQAFEDLRDVTEITRVVMLRGFNDGGLPRPGEKYHIRAQEAWSRTDTNFKDRYNFDLPVDVAYTDMVKEVATKGFAVMTTATMVDGMLRGFYENEGVVQSIVYRLHLNESRFLFMSVASYTAEFTKKQRMDIERRVARMCALVESVEGEGTNINKPLGGM